MTSGAIHAFDGPRGPVDYPRDARQIEPPSSPLRGILFDATELVYDATMWRRRLLRLVRQLGLDATYADFFRPWDRDYHLDVYCGRREFGEALESFLLAAGLSWAQIDEVEAASRFGRQSLETNVRPPGGIIKALAECAAMGLTPVAWVDAPHPAAALADRLDRMSLARSFRSVLTSCDVEAVQPASACYQAALASLALPAQEVLYVGHAAAHLAGAKSAGLATAAFNFPPGAKADVYLSRVEDLASYLRGQAPAATLRRAA